MNLNQKQNLSLSNEQELKYLKTVAAGDETAEGVLIEANIGLIRYIANRFALITNYEKEDLISIGALGFLKGIRSFNEEKCNRISSYYTTCITNEILGFFRKEKKHFNLTSLNEPANYNNDTLPPLEETLISSDLAIVDNLIAQTEIKELYQAVNKLNEIQKKVVILHYFKEKLQREIAVMLECTPANVSRYNRLALKNLKEIIINQRVFQGLLPVNSIFEKNKIACGEENLFVNPNVLNQLSAESNNILSLIYLECEKPNNLISKLNIPYYQIKRLHKAGLEELFELIQNNKTIESDQTERKVMVKHEKCI